MRYELLVQPAVPGGQYDPEPVERALLSRGMRPTPEGLRWALPSGEVEVRPLVEGGKLLATELRVPLSERPELVRELLQQAGPLAQELGVLLFDPQLARVVNEKDEGLVSDQYLRTARYAGEMLGLPEAVAASFAPHAPEELSSGVKMLLWGVGGLALLYLVVDRLLS